MTTDDHTSVLLLGDVALRQVLAARDDDDVATLLRLNLVAAGVPTHRGSFIGVARPRTTSRARHAAAEAPGAAPRRFAARPAPRHTV